MALDLSETLVDAIQSESLWVRVSCGHIPQLFDSVQ